jgi:bacterioferritin-associated ferredoxin
MIICSCNVLSDHDVRSMVRNAAPRTTYQVYGCLGCSAQCGRCAHTIRKIMDEAQLGAKAAAGGGAAARPAEAAEASSTLPQYLQTT